MNVDSILISEYAHAPDGKLTVVGVFNKIGPGKLPLQLATMAVTIVVHAHHDEAGTVHQGELRLIDETRKVIKSQPLEIKFAKEGIVPGIPLRAVVIALLLGPKFETAGAYAFEVYIDDIYSAAAAFVVVEAE